jgi:hypothetical protein
MDSLRAIPPTCRGDPWFDDGNIILTAEGDNGHVLKAFKVHRGVLARKSEFFGGMFEIPRPTTSLDPVEQTNGYPVVRMHDRADELSYLIKALYDSPYVMQYLLVWYRSRLSPENSTFYLRNVEDFYYLAGILRLSTKYDISNLRIQATQYLIKTWPYTIGGHDEMVNQALTAPRSVDDTTYPYVHPLHVLKLAREVDLQIIVPAALYFLSTYPLDQLRSGEHPKLQSSHPSRPSNELSLEDVSQYTLMYQYRINITLEFIWKTCGERKCQTQKECPQVLSRFNIDQTLIPSMGAFHLMAQAMQCIDKDDAICGPCKRAFSKDVSELRERHWRELPSVVGLRSWEELLASDLPL